MASDIEEAIKTAKGIVGEHASGDYLLKPRAHAESFKTSAPELAALLDMERLSGIAKQYERRDAQAVVAQNRFKQTTTVANAAVMVAAIASALMMAAEILSKVLAEDSTVRWPFLADCVRPLGVVSALAAAIAAAALFVIRNGSLLENWMGKRALAETARLAYFAALTAETKPSMSLELLTLEYFRRFQCNVQEAFYGTRGARHQRSANLTMGVAVVGVIVSALVGGSVIAGEGTALAAIAVIGAAISAFAAAREAMTQDSRNAERYDRTLEALQGLVGTRLDDVRKAVAGGDHASLVEFVNAVHEQLSVEHRQWLESSEATKEGLSKLDAALEAARKKKA